MTLFQGPLFMIPDAFHYSLCCGAELARFAMQAGEPQSHSTKWEPCTSRGDVAVKRVVAPCNSEFNRGRVGGWLSVGVAIPVEVHCEAYWLNLIWNLTSLMWSIWWNLEINLSTCQESTRNFNLNFGAKFGEDFGNFHTVVLQCGLLWWRGYKSMVTCSSAATTFPAFMVKMLVFSRYAICLGSPISKTQFLTPMRRQVLEIEVSDMHSHQNIFFGAAAAADKLASKAI